MKPSFYLLIICLISITLINCKSAQKNGDTATTDSAATGSPAQDAVSADTATTGTTPLEGTYWKLVELNGQPVVMAENQSREQHMILQPGDSTVKGNGGCNGFGGNYELKPGDRIKFSRIISTMMACDNTETENRFFKVLETADNYNLVNDTLVLNRARMAPLARFKAVHLN